jgi:hypothetical protein
MKAADWDKVKGNFKSQFQLLLRVRPLGSWARSWWRKYAPCSGFLVTVGDVMIIVVVDALCCGGMIAGK